MASCTCDLAKRLDSLERRYRRLQAGFAAGLAVVALTTLVAAAGSQTVRARKFEVDDSAGRARIVLTVGSSTNQPYIDFMNASGKLMSAVQLTTTGYGDVRMWDSRGTERLDLESSPDPGLSMFTSGGNYVMFTGTHSDGMSGLDIYDRQGAKRVFLGQYTEGGAGLSLNDPEKRLQIGIVTSSDGPNVQLLDSGGTKRIYLGTYTDGTWGLHLKNSSGSTIWSEP